MKLNKYAAGRRYGKALFELAIETQQAENIYQDLLAIREIFHQVPGLGAILSDVRLEPYEKIEILKPLVQNFEGITQNFLHVVNRYNRMNDLLFMIDEYEYRYDESKSILLGTVSTAVPLSKEQHQALEQKAATLLGYQQVCLTNVVDPQIVGGVVIEANNKIIDGSIQKQLETIRASLLN